MNPNPLPSLTTGSAGSLTADAVRPNFEDFMTEPLSPLSFPRFGWVLFWVALISFIAQLALCQFFSFGSLMPVSTDVNPSNLWRYAYHFPPTGQFFVLNWLGVAYFSPPLNPFTALANLPVWLFFTAYMPLVALLALLAMTAFLREMEVHPWAAIFGGVLYSWQGDLLPFILPGHFAYALQASLFAVAAWAVLRLIRTERWIYALILGLSCGWMVQMLLDRGAIASLFIAGFFLLGSSWRRRNHLPVRSVALKFGAGVMVAVFIALSSILGTFQTTVEGVRLGNSSSPLDKYALVTQFCLPPDETLTFAVPGFYGWASNGTSEPYWGRVGQWNGPATYEQGSRFNLAISTIGTPGSIFVIIGLMLLLHATWVGGETLSLRQRYFGRGLLIAGGLGLILSWGDYTPLYHLLYQLPLMDKWRNPLKWLEITTFVLPVCSAFGLHHVLLSLRGESPEVQTMRSTLQTFYSILLMLAVLFFLNSFIQTLLIDDTFVMIEFDSATVDHLHRLMHVSSFIAALLTFVCGAAIWLSWDPKRLSRYHVPNPHLDRAWQFLQRPDLRPLTLTLFFCLLTCLQLGWVDTHFIYGVPTHYLTDGNDLLASLAAEGNQVRVKISAEDETLNRLLQNQIYSLPISTLDVSAASRTPEDLSAFFQALIKAPSRLYDLAGVKTLATPSSKVPDLQKDPYLKANIARVDGYSLVPTGSDQIPSHALIRFRSYLQKATYIPYAEVHPNRNAVLERLNDLDWDLHTRVLLEKDRLPAGLVLPNVVDPDVKPVAAAPPLGFTRMLTYNSTKIEFKVQAAKPGYVLINDYFNSDWEARLNGQPAPLLRADYLLRAVSVPAGETLVQLTYRQQYHFGSLSIPVLPINLFDDGLSVLAVMVISIGLARKGVDHD